MAYLEIRGPKGNQRVTLDEQRVRIGRHPSNFICVQDERVSRFHCEIAPGEGGYTLRDLGSSNGTLVGDARIEQVQLSDGDQFVIGSTRLRFIASAPAEQQTQQQHQEQPAQGRKFAMAGQNGNGDGGLDDDGDSSPIEVSGGDLHVEEAVEQPVSAGRGRSDFGSGSLDALLQAGKDVGFGPDDVALVNARGSVVHAADKGGSSTADTIRIMRLLMLGCMRCGASDVHLEPGKEGGLVRMRIDGAMARAAELPAGVFRRLTSLVKVLSDIDISKKALVQEGHFSVQAPDRRVDYRVSFTPAMHGQKLVVRILDPMNSPQKISDLNLPGWMQRQVQGLARQDTGMLLACGPTGSGKTTTLYAILRQIDTSQRNVITIEDPIEYELPGATQIPVDEDQGNSFHTLLRSVLRQDPDVIMVGEIRDKATAITAMQAAATGHLVLSTVHAKDTIGTIFRLLDLGVEPYLVANTLNLILAQRLARELCPHCKMSRRPTPSQTMRMGRAVEGLKEIFVPGSCSRCFGTGYAGRRAVFELLTVNEDMRDVILNSPSIADLRKAIGLTMFTSLQENGTDLVKQGVTSMEEIERVVGLG
ncbi:MAG: ATPase, T2SS/T4P/T4SS family [Phycisphaeraceae bacterium]